MATLNINENDLSNMVVSHHQVSPRRADIDQDTGYIRNIEDIRRDEYPHLADAIYLDHAGTVPCAKSLITGFAADLATNLYGNPHSASASSQRSSKCIDDTRLEVLKFFGASPDAFEVVFTANATAAIKLVAEAFRDNERGFHYGYHSDSHTSLVGVRELAINSVCLNDDGAENWLSGLDNALGQREGIPFLFAYPGQSNMTGQRHSLDWCRKVRSRSKSSKQPIYTLFDAAALVSTSPLDLSNEATAPDFTVLSFYKIFGFPDLGALIIRKSAACVFAGRRYFAGGTVDSVAVNGDLWHAKKENLHSSLEEGTLPFHNIIALQHAFRVHKRLYGSMRNISRHTDLLTGRLYDQLRDLKHGNGHPVCKIFRAKTISGLGSGPIIALNLVNGAGEWISNSEVEKLAIIKGFQFRTGAVCNPGGVAAFLGLSSDDLRSNHAAGYRCGRPSDILGGWPTGVIRLSLGATSSMRDVDNFVAFLREFYVDEAAKFEGDSVSQSQRPSSPDFVVESLSVYPIKSCAAFTIPSHVEWEVHPKGLAWDREWCLVHQGTNVTLSQKQFPQMALLQPKIDLARRTITISHMRWASSARATIVLDLDEYPDTEGVMDACSSSHFKQQESLVCGEKVLIHLYTNHKVSSFFSEALGVPCTLARYPREGQNRYANIRKLTSTPETSPERSGATTIKLSNESPILLVSRSSVNHLNEQIKNRASSHGQPQSTVRTPLTSASFRGNIVIAQKLSSPNQPELPYIEDEFLSLQTRNVKLDVLGPCQRCQMICIDPQNAKRSQEPFSTLAKTRRKEGRVWFGMHLCMATADEEEDDEEKRKTAATIKAGDAVVVNMRSCL